MSDSLVLIADGKRMGEVIFSGERLSLRYDEAWQSSGSAFPLSLSMPLVSAEHGHRAVEAFLWGLLPDNDSVLERWGRRFQISPRNPFRLLQHVGEDCAGAVQFVRPEPVDRLLTGNQDASVTWLNDDDLDARIAAVIEDASATRLGGDTGQFSLAGAQPKIALYRDSKSNQWGVPEGRTPTTHILKPATGAFDGQMENEHFCLRLAAELGFPTAHSSVTTCGATPVIVVERYDRVETDGIVRRIHQEDLCQAAGIRPHLKYQSQGGPSPKVIGELLYAFSSSPEADVRRFADCMAFNWLTASTDSHAKNYSILIAANARARLAPLYDLASALPYALQIQPRKAALAMKVGSHYRIREIGRPDWEKLARELRLGPAEFIDRIIEIAGLIPDAARVTAESLENGGLKHPVISLILEKLCSHSAERAEALKSQPSHRKSED